MFIRICEPQRSGEPLLSFCERLHQRFRILYAVLEWKPYRERKQFGQWKPLGKLNRGRVRDALGHRKCLRNCERPKPYRIRIGFRIFYSVLDWNTSELGEFPGICKPFGQLNRGCDEQSERGRDSFCYCEPVQPIKLSVRIWICRTDWQRNCCSEQKRSTELQPSTKLNRDCDRDAERARDSLRKRNKQLQPNGIRQRISIFYTVSHGNTCGNCKRAVFKPVGKLNRECDRDGAGDDDCLGFSCGICESHVYEKSKRSCERKWTDSKCRGKLHMAECDELALRKYCEPYRVGECDGIGQPYRIF
jgi:hypothetical protein